MLNLTLCINSECDTTVVNTFFFFFLIPFMALLMADRQQRAAGPTPALGSEDRVSGCGMHALSYHGVPCFCNSLSHRLKQHTQHNATCLLKAKLSPKYNLGFFMNVPKSNLLVKA